MIARMFPHTDSRLPVPDDLPVRWVQGQTALSAAFQEAVAKRTLKLGAKEEPPVHEAEIEVTPEMIKAGMDEWYGGDCFVGSAESAKRETIMAIYKAMVLAKRKGCSAL